MDRPFSVGPFPYGTGPLFRDLLIAVGLLNKDGFCLIGQTKAVLNIVNLTQKI